MLSVLVAGGCSDNPPVTSSKRWVTVRLADAKDLDFSIYSVKPGPNGFPRVTTALLNRSDDPLLIAFTPIAITLHCGDYQQRGPGGDFIYRRDVIDGGQCAFFAAPVANWTKTDSKGNAELLVPIDLPPGQYELWVTVRLIDERDVVLTSAPVPFERIGAAK